MSRGENGMNRESDAAFYSAIPVFDDFGRLMEPSLYRPLPDGWLIGIADIVRSTDAIADQRYKAVNMAGAAVIAAMTNAMELRDFPFVFGGDGASFAVAAADRKIAERALAETAAWVKEALDLTMRVALIPIEAIRAEGLDVSVARYAPSPNVSYAMFEGGGLKWADAAMKRGAFAVPQAPRGSHPDLTGLSCHFSEIMSARGVMLSILVVPHGEDKSAFRAVIERMLALVEMSPEGAVRSRRKARRAAGLRRAWTTSRALANAVPCGGGASPSRDGRCGSTCCFASICASVDFPRRSICARWSRTPTSGNTTTACGW